MVEKATQLPPLVSMYTHSHPCIRKHTCMSRNHTHTNCAHMITCPHPQKLNSLTPANKQYSYIHIHVSTLPHQCTHIHMHTLTYTLSHTHYTLAHLAVFPSWGRRLLLLIIVIIAIGGVINFIIQSPHERTHNLQSCSSHPVSRSLHL